jgi:hypothetical protein
LGNTKKPRKEFLRKQACEFQRDKANVKLPNHWAPELGFEVIFRNEEHHENMERAGNIDSSAIHELRLSEFPVHVPNEPRHSK